MRLFLIISAIIFAVLSLIFTLLPLGTIAFLPVVLTFIFSLLAFLKSKDKQRILPRIILIISVLNLLVVVGKIVLIKDKVVNDKQFELKKEESKKEDIKDLEGL